MVAKADFHMIAPGFNNENNLTPLHLYDSRYFQIYNKFIDATWNIAEGFEPSAATREKPVNLPFSIWKFVLLTKTEVQFLKTTLSMTTEIDAEVTIRTYDSWNDYWRNYNGIMKFPREISTLWNQKETWDNLEIRFESLKLLPLP